MKKNIFRAQQFEATYQRFSTFSKMSCSPNYPKAQSPFEGKSLSWPLLQTFLLKSPKLCYEINNALTRTLCSTTSYDLLRDSRTTKWETYMHIQDYRYFSKFIHCLNIHDMKYIYTNPSFAMAKVYVVPIIDCNLLNRKLEVNSC